MSAPPSGRFKRALGIAKVGARTGVAWAASRGSEAAAKKSVEILGNLRGIAAKIGQTASYVDGFVPEEQREVYAKALKTLQRATPASPWPSVRRVLEEELSAPIDVVFSQFEESPSASASIGQVHRATLQDGTRVAVKIQHEGIDRAVESDLRNLGLLEGVVALAGPRGVKAGPIFEEVMARFRAELDYRQEASFQTAFLHLHQAEERILVPQVYPEFCSQRVLVSEWIDGLSMDEAVQQPEEIRRLYAQALWRFVFRGNLVGGGFNADPHPGNYIFQPDGRVHFLDFGCVQPLPDSLRRPAVRAHQAAVDNRLEDFDAAIAEMLGTAGGSFGEASRLYTRRLFEPLMKPNYHLTHEYASALVKEAQRLQKAMRVRDGSLRTPPPQLALMNRLQFGFYSVLAMLNVRVDYQQVEREFLAEAASVEHGLLRLC